MGRPITCCEICSNQENIKIGMLKCGICGMRICRDCAYFDNVNGKRVIKCVKCEYSEFGED